MEGLTLSGLNSVDCSLKGKCSLVWVCCAFDRFWSWYIHNAILKVLTENCWNWRYCVVKIQCSKDNCKYWLWCTAKWWIDLLDFASFWLLYRLWNSIAKRKRTKRKTYMLEWMTFFHWPTSDLQIELKCLILTTGKSFYVCVCVCTQMWVKAETWPMHVHHDCIFNAKPFHPNKQRHWCFGTSDRDCTDLIKSD